MVDGVVVLKFAAMRRGPDSPALWVIPVAVRGLLVRPRPEEASVLGREAWCCFFSSVWMPPTYLILLDILRSGLFPALSVSLLCFDKELLQVILTLAVGSGVLSACISTSATRRPLDSVHTVGKSLAGQVLSDWNAVPFGDMSGGRSPE